MAKTKRKKPAAHPAAPAARSPQAQQPPPDTTDKTARWMGALCYLSVLILIPACSKWRRDAYVRFHLNQGLVLLALATLCGAIAMVPGAAEVGITLTVLVDLLSFVGLVYAFRGRKTPLPLVAQLVRSFHPF